MSFPISLRILFTQADAPASCLLALILAIECQFVCLQDRTVEKREGDVGLFALVVGRLLRTYMSTQVS